MIRTMTLVALLAAGTIVGLAPNSASAQPPLRYPTWPGSPVIYPPRPNLPGHGHDHDHGHSHKLYTVLIRHRGHWDVYSSHRDRDDAQRAARRLEYRGYDTRIERTNGR